MLEVDLTSTVRKRLGRALLVRAAQAALKGRKGSLSVVVIGATRMRNLNRDTLGHDYAADVLSFDHGQTPDGGMLGEVIVCPDVAVREAARAGVPVEQELARYVVHGCLHLNGHDDLEPDGRKKMWAAQERVLKALFGTRYRDPGPH